MFKEKHMSRSLIGSAIAAMAVSNTGAASKDVVEGSRDEKSWRIAKADEANGGISGIDEVI